MATTVMELRLVGAPVNIGSSSPPATGWSTRGLGRPACGRRGFRLRLSEPLGKSAVDEIVESIRADRRPLGSSRLKLQVAQV